MRAGTPTPQTSHAATGGHGGTLFPATFGPSSQLFGTNGRFAGTSSGGAMVIGC